ncbi:MAG: HEAT repeat domain-containing protein [Chloroflexi bacterium]|nr:HEAT repeat domain-containing protein [Chloroflexota bacterium]
MARRHFHPRAHADGQHLAELRRNPFVFAVALVSLSVLLMVLVAARSATASEDTPTTGVAVARDHDVALMFALRASNPQVRLRAAQDLGWRRSTEAADALIAATYDADARVREEATTALGEIGAFQALSRLRELQVVQGNENIQRAAFEAEQQLAGQVARGLQVPRSKVQAFTVAPTGHVYAAANDAFYVQRDESWARVGHLPDTPVALAVTADGHSIYAATIDAGLNRSENDGKTWARVQFGMDTPTQLSVTAMAVDPKDARRLYIALASTQLDGVTKTPLGIATSNDSGKTWVMLPAAPAWALTTRLILDVATPEYLYGVADGTPWRYALINVPGW